ncbi:MAG: metal ABC transporter ATP-binding protein [Candidatus Magasanikbacteria bacterium]
MLIKVQNLSYKFNDFTALENVSFEIAKGEIVAIIGPNGSGKTTLIKNIIGVLEPTEGSVMIDGKKPKEIRHKIGYVPQKFEFDKTIPISVHEFMSLEKCGKKGHDEKNIIEALREVGLEDVEEKQLGSLSGGQFQRVMIARALLHEKEILIFDEPSTGIDIAGEKTIYDLIKKINEERGTTCLIVSHELNVVNKYTKKVICINKEMVCFGAPEIVITKETLEKLYGSDTGLFHAHDHIH